MTTVPVHIVSAFVEADGRGGNPAGVVLEADPFDADAKQAIATALDFSETAFVSGSTVADIKLDFFTPIRQIAHCGHATIATFSYLAQQGHLTRDFLTMETIDGTNEVHLRGDRVFMEQRAPQYIPLDATPVEPEDVWRSLGTVADAARRRHAPEVVNTGNALLMVPLRDEAAVADVTPDHEAIEAISETLDLIGYYVFSRETQQPGRHAGARMFAPRFGIPEESATGMAAGPLACYLHDRMGVDATRLVIEQGALMDPPSPSVITVELDVEGGAIQRLLAGGRGRRVETRTVDVDLNG